MLRRTKKGLIIWGSILLCFSLYFITAYFLAGNGWQARDMQSRIAAIIIFLFLSAGGVTMLTFGIINAVLTANHNRELLSRNLTFTANCIYCGGLINCTVRDFRPHRRYPEGYTACPYCKRPVSKNAFGVYQNNPPYQS